MLFVSIVTTIGVLAVSLVIFRLSVCLPQYRRRRTNKVKAPLRAMAFFGSG
jgi:heme/copper-type cytochrome/quinol oxidase subunit 2